VVIECAGTTSWRLLQPGVEYGVFPFGGEEAPPAQVAQDEDPNDTRLHVVRIDPARARLAAQFASRLDGEKRTTRVWSAERKLAAAINLGMFQQDHLSNVGYARTAGHVNNPRWNNYQSVFLAGPKEEGLPRAQLIDLDQPGARELVEKYRTVVQNLRLIKRDGTEGAGVNVWGASEKSWSEAAVAMDRRGRILFLFCRDANTMRDFNRKLLGLPLEIVRAMHVEGGPEASLSLHAGGVNLDFYGSEETGFFDNSNAEQWSIPNVLGVLREE